MTMLTTRSAFLMALSLSLLFTVTGCGGGGGGSSDAVTPPPADVMIGTIAFNPASSRDIASHTFGFPTNVAQAWRITTWAGATGDYNSMTFADATIVVGATLLPVYRVKYTYGAVAAGVIVYSYWATATNGGIYNLTGQDGTDGGGEPFILINGVGNGGGPEVMATQPRLILPPAPTISNSWTADGVTGFGVGYAINGATRTVMSMNATSPSGFTGCMRIRAVSPSGSLPTNVDEYWKPGYGVVEVLVVETTTPSNIYFRTGIAFSG